MARRATMPSAKSVPSATYIVRNKVGWTASEVAVLQTVTAAVAMAEVSGRRIPRRASKVIVVATVAMAGAATAVATVAMA